MTVSSVAESPPGIKSPLKFARFGIRLGKDPYGALEDLHDRYGDIASVSAGRGQQFVFMFGRDANSFILSQHKELFRFRESYQSLVPVDGETALVVSDGEDHARRRRLVQPAFRPHSLDGYLTQMTEEVNRVITRLPRGAVVDLYEQFRSAVRRTVIRSLFGEHLSERADEIGDTLEPALEFVNLPPQKQLKIKVVGSRYHSALKARALTDLIIDAEVTRRNAMDPPQRPDNDVLAMLLAPGEDGMTLTQQELRDQIVSPIAAGYDTTSGALGWAIHELVTSNVVWKRSRDEIREVVGDRQLKQDDIARLVYLDGIVNETLRLHPPGVIAPRYAVADFEFAGKHVPKGSLVFYSAYITQRDPELWTDPDAFLPQRWDPLAPDFRPVVPYSFVTFGGGSRRCIGFGYAILELKAFLVEIIRRLTVRPDYDGTRTAEGIATVRPAGGIPVQILRVEPSVRG